MNEVKRYDAGCDYAGEEEMVERADGDFVRHEDYAALKDSAMDYAYRWSKAQDDIKKAHMLHSMQKEEIANLKEQLTATTNSLTNAQEALKSAVIEADTVQAGVMELVSRMNQVVAENKVLDDALGAIADAYETGMADLLAKEIDTAVNIETPSTDAYLNAVRADAIESVVDALTSSGALTVGDSIVEAVKLAERIRAGNAGKDGSHD